MADADNKTCTKCRELKPVSDFRARKLKSGTASFESKCIPCEREYKRDWKRNKGPTGTASSRRDRKRELTYGITRDEMINILLEQDFRCPICLNPLNFEKMCVDHSHETGKVRGMLDPSCNTALGKFKDNVATLSRAQVYLEVNSA